MRSAMDGNKRIGLIGLCAVASMLAAPWSTGLAEEPKAADASSGTLPVGADGGKLNLDFLPETSPLLTDENSIENQFIENYTCHRCKCSDARVERVSTTGTGFAKLIQKEFLAVSCQDCGLTEFYNLSVLEGRSDLQNFLRGIFGL